MLKPALCTALSILAAAAAHAAPPAPAPLPRDAVEGLSGLPVPRFVSLGAGQANMRSGPGERYPVTWLYQRRGLPMRVVKEYGIWRQVQDPDGMTGWMNKNLVVGDRTGFVTRDVEPLRAAADDHAKVVWRVEKGVIGKLDRCNGAGWCHMSVGGQTGWVRTEALFGVEAREAFK